MDEVKYGVTVSGPQRFVEEVREEVTAASDRFDIDIEISQADRSFTVRICAGEEHRELAERNERILYGIASDAAMRDPDRIAVSRCSQKPFSNVDAHQ